MKKIFLLLIIYFTIISQVFSEVTLLCHTTNWNLRDMTTNKVDYSEVKPSRWTLVIEFLDDENIIVRPQASAESGGKCGPGLGTFNENEIRYVCKHTKVDEKGEIFVLNRFSGLYETKSYVSYNQNDWYINTAGSCQLSKRKI